jgi:hypothetical protein
LFGYIRSTARIHSSDGLIIVKYYYNKKLKATHHSMSPNYAMPQAYFTFLLDQLAKNALSRAKDVADGGA